MTDNKKLLWRRLRDVYNQAEDVVQVTKTSKGFDVLVISRQLDDVRAETVLEVVQTHIGDLDYLVDNLSAYGFNDPRAAWRVQSYQPVAAFDAKVAKKSAKATA